MGLRGHFLSDAAEPSVNKHLAVAAAKMFVDNYFTRNEMNNTFTIHIGSLIPVLMLRKW